jgi:phosphodiesterase/alkaline phosphatase D-like protein
VFNPHIRFFDGDRRGYVRCRLDHEQMLTDLQMVSTVRGRMRRSRRSPRSWWRTAVSGRTGSSPGDGPLGRI